MRTVNVRPWRKRRKLGQELRGIAIRPVGVAICLVLCEIDLQWSACLYFVNRQQRKGYFSRWSGLDKATLGSSAALLPWSSPSLT